MQTISFSRGYVFADMAFKGAKFRVVNTHLEVGGMSESIQNAQAKEFVTKVKKGATNVVATGDFNTDAYYSAASYRIRSTYFTDSLNVKKDGQGLPAARKRS